MCGAFLILPEICVFTGATEDLVVRTAVVQYPSFRLVIFRRQCRIQYYLTWAEDRKRRRISFLTTGGIIFGLMLMFASIPTGMFVLCRDWTDPVSDPVVREVPSECDYWIEPLDRRIQCPGNIQDPRLPYAVSGNACCNTKSDGKFCPGASVAGVSLTGNEFHYCC